MIEEIAAAEMELLVEEDEADILIGGDKYLVLYLDRVYELNKAGDMYIVQEDQEVAYDG